MRGDDHMHREAVVLGQQRRGSASTLQYVTVYSNHTKGGFAGSEPVGNPENFRCAFNLRQGAGQR